jgi:ATP/ADP translocase
MRAERLVAVVPERSEIRTGVMKAVMAFLLQSLEVPRSGLAAAVVVKPVEVMLAVLVVVVLATKTEPEAQETQTLAVVVAAQEMLVAAAAVLAVLALLS